MCVSSLKCHSSPEYNVINQADFACSISVTRFVHMHHDEITHESCDDHIADTRPCKQKKTTIINDYCRSDPTNGQKQQSEGHEFLIEFDKWYYSDDIYVPR
jgi:hypothetical protein